MQLRLHANATTTPRTRAYIQKSRASHAALARELGIHPRTVARWKTRQDVADRSTRPHRLATTISEWEEALIVELRRSLALPLDDILEAMRRCLNPKLSRSGIHRCLQRHGLSARLTPDKAPAVTFQTDAPAGFIHVDVKYLPPLGRRRSYAYRLPQRRLGSRSTAPPALSISKSCPTAGPPPPPVSSPAFSTASRSRFTPS
jgi:transposase-like protein